MIHEALIQAKVAHRYYKMRYPSRQYTVQQAGKQLLQDKSIDMKLLKAVLRQIFHEQNEIINATKEIRT